MSERLQLVQVVSDEHESHISTLLLEDLQWLQEEVKQEYGISVDVHTTLQSFMNGLDVSTLYMEEHTFVTSMVHISVKSHSENGPCRTARGEKSAVVGIVL